MTTVSTVTSFLDLLCPPPLAETWDNVGLLVGDLASEVRRVMTCLTVTAESVDEAIRQRAELIVSHHPVLFQPINRLTTATAEGTNLLRLIAAGAAIYSPHTAFDSAADGINQRLATGLGLSEIVPLLSRETDPPGTGGGRCGMLASGSTLTTLAERAKTFLNIPRAQIVGPPDRAIGRVGVACGSAGDFLAQARAMGCDCLVTGETRFHTCLEAEATGVALLLIGHYASERFAVEHLAGVIQKEFSTLSVWASRDERDPLDWI
ncbi:MAG: Nif3-like dinuclear metal center hexameric protein [Planctomycetia bacterium]|nr:Nif3-like dinuclear metal center hexameric protein [Planctomycetia bacterium]